MAQERKAADGPSLAAKGNKSPVPPTKKDDIEDVAWALQTAEATWSRGDFADALKWIRRAAEAASEAELDDRALELAKAAADVASLLTHDRPTAVAPPPIPGASAPPPLPSRSSKPPPAQPATSAPARSAAPMASKVATNMPPLPRPGQKGPTPPRVQGAAVPMSKRGRRSSPSVTDEVNLGEVRLRRASTTNETKKGGRRSKPSIEEGPATARHPSTDDIEAWPTASLVGDEDDDGIHTRVGTPAYRETAHKASARPPPGELAPLVMSQAVRVVVWRGADGVHVAPAGTHVAAIGVEAVLVALDPGTDLAAWLSNK
ncbi:MAG TPA: hypothetical protein VGI39_36030 [Polyangiaceae bacterium]|jgi:hypothetical protein